MGDWRKVVHCRNRAELLRTIAHGAKHDAHKTVLRRVAEHYDALAAEIERDAKNGARWRGHAPEPDSLSAH